MFPPGASSTEHIADESQHKSAISTFLGGNSSDLGLQLSSGNPDVNNTMPLRDPMLAPATISGLPDKGKPSAALLMSEVAVGKPSYVSLFTHLLTGLTILTTVQNPPKRGVTKELIQYNCLYKGCTEVYQNRRNRDRHMDTHFGKTHECPRCQKLFARSDSLKRHFKSMPACHDIARQRALGGDERVLMRSFALHSRPIWHFRPGLDHIRVSQAHSADPLRGSILRLQASSHLPLR